LLGDKEKLDDLYRKELCAVLDLQSVLLDQIIPDMVSDLGMNESSRHYTEEWAKDTRTRRFCDIGPHAMTTSLQRHGFVAYFALEDAREILMRRLELLRRPKMDSKGFVICLPPTSLDPFGRPTIIIKPTKL
ncbi:hypothetical protein FOMPIDRAFT_1080129, partial [Fomitopsis schrenkii]